MAQARIEDMGIGAWAIMCMIAAICLVASWPVRADELILDDLIVDGSQCLGNDCINGENFGYDTLRLKEHNLRIKFEDTSHVPGYPTNDWQIRANDHTSGGLSGFSIDDIDGGTTPFTIEAGAPSQSLYLDDNGRLGLGTNSPLAEVHAKDGDSPTIRLEQDSSSGWTPQTWDISGNETNFYIRDATYGSNLCFRIQPGAPSSSLSIRQSGNVGIGTWGPEAHLHVHKKHESDEAETVARFDIDDDSLGKLEIKNYSGGDGVFRPYIESTTQGNYIGLTVQASVETDSNTNPAMIFDARIAGAGSGAAGRLTSRHLAEFRNNQTTRVTIDAEGNVTATSFPTTSSRQLKDDIRDLDRAKAIDALHALNPVEFVYKTDPDERHVGFISEDVPDLVASNDRKTVNGMDVLAVVTQVVKDQQQTIEQQNRAISQLAKEVQSLRRGLESGK